MWKLRITLGFLSPIIKNISQSKLGSSSNSCFLPLWITCNGFEFCELTLISYLDDLLLTKPKARTGQVRKFNFVDLPDCERVT